MLKLVETVSGWKTHLVGAVLIVIGFAEMFGIDVVPDIDGSNAFTTIITGFGLIAGRDALRSEMKHTQEASSADSRREVRAIEKETKK